VLNHCVPRFTERSEELAMSLCIEAMFIGPMISEKEGGWCPIYWACRVGTSVTTVND
jgi:hypothetical protein